jgi:hypothetical protein
MSLQTVTVFGVEFDVYYDLTVVRDAYGTGDSPTDYELEIESIEVVGDVQDLSNVLSDRVIELIEEQIIELEK